MTSVAVPTLRRPAPFATVALFVVGVVTAVVLLLPAAPDGLQTAVSSLGLLLAGTSGALCCLLRARVLSGLRRRPWVLLGAAGFVAVLGNLWGAAVGSDPVHDPSTVGNLALAAALVIAIAGLLTFVSFRRRGADRLVMVLDGLVVGGALLLIVSALVFPQLLDATQSGVVAQATTLGFPVLDVALVTLSVLVVLRSSRVKRLPLGLVGVGFVMYGISDLVFAVQTADGSFTFGTPVDLGWILGYLLIGAAALTPVRDVPADDDDTQSLPPAVGSAFVLGLTVVAVVVQALYAEPDRSATLQLVVLVVVVSAAGARQVLLTADNTSLRRSLERRVAEQTADLRRLVHQQEALLDSVGEGIYGVATDGTITFANPAAQRTLGWSAEELVGARAHERFHAPDSDDQTHSWQDCPVHQAIVDGVGSTLEEQFRRADGKVIPVESTAAPLRDDRDVVQGAVVVFREISQRREVDRMKNEFLSVVSHELRTPLTAILGSLDLIGSGELGDVPAPVSQLVGVASRSSHRLSRLISDLLDMERIESGKQPMRLVTVDAGDLVRSAVQQVLGLAASVDITVRAGHTEGTVTADEDQIVQTLINLLGNAVKFSPRGSEVVVESRESGAHVEFSVRDHGRGIPPEKLESIFERFQQVDSSDARSLGGTGLGLTISKAIVQRHGGRIWATSEVGVGTTMSFRLPSTRRTTAQARGRAVVVHDDDPEVVDTYVAALEHHGYRAVGVTDPARVIEVLDRERPDLLLLDGAPGTSGADVLLELGHALDREDLVVVVVSGMGPESDPVAAAASVDWLVKPVDQRHLVTTVERAIEGRGRHGSGVVLLVEDDDELVAVVSTLLEEDDLDVVSARTAAEAIELGARLHPDVIVLDVMLPDGDGGDVIADYRRRGLLTGTPLIVYTALPPGETRDLSLGQDVYLQKSRSNPDELRAQVLSLVAAATGGTDARQTTSDPVTTGTQPTHVAAGRTGPS